MYAVMMFLYTVWESHDSLNENITTRTRNPLCREPFVSRAKALLATKSDKGYEDKNAKRSKELKYKLK